MNRHTCSFTSNFGIKGKEGSNSEQDWGTWLSILIGTHFGEVCGDNVPSQ